MPIRVFALFVMLAAGSAGCHGRMGASGTNVEDDATGGSAGRGGAANPPASGGSASMPGDPPAPPVDPEVEEPFELPGDGVDGTARLSRIEYANTVASLFPGVSLPAVILPADLPDANHSGFAGQTKALTDVELTQYVEAAEAIGAVVARSPDKLAICDFAKQPEACVAKVIDELGPRIMRRPLADDDRSRLLALHAKVRTDLAGTNEEALAAVVARLLVSPLFLHKIEIGRPAAELGPSVRVLDAYELASRLSFFLWRSGPDRDLFEAARAGKLASASEVEAQARRLIADEKASAVVWEFHQQWLDLARLDGVDKKDARWGDSLREAMREETRQFVRHVAFAGKGGWTALMNGRFSFVSEPMARLYGLPTGQPVDQPTQFPAEVRRGGVFGHASFLAGHADAETSNPILRAVTVFERALCRQLPTVPANVDTTQMKDRLADPFCGACHRRFEPLGLGLERYGALGEDRVKAGAKAVVGEISESREIDGTFEGAEELGGRLVSGMDGSYCYTRQWFRFFAHRLEGPSDAGSVEQAWRAFRDAKYDVRELLVAVTRTKTFRTRLLSEGTPAPACN